jgi:curved DNA-binding protein CbpA
MKKDYYSVLGVPKTASQEQIKKAYHALALKYHPDRNKSPGAEDRIKEINEAYRILGDPEKRKEYEWRSQNPSPNPTWTADDEDYYQAHVKKDQYERAYDQYANAHKGEGYTSASDYHKAKKAPNPNQNQNRKKPPERPATEEEFNEFRDGVVHGFEKAGGSVFDMFFGKDRPKPDFFKKKK